MLIFAALNGKVFLVRKIRGPDRGHVYAMKVSICPAFVQYLSSICPRCYRLIFLTAPPPPCMKVSITSDSFPVHAGVEEISHCGEEEVNRAQKDGAAGV